MNNREDVVGASKFLQCCMHGEYLNGVRFFGFSAQEESAAIWRERRFKMATTSARRRVPVTITWVVGKRKNGTCAAAHYLWFQKNVHAANFNRV